MNRAELQAHVRELTIAIVALPKDAEHADERRRIGSEIARVNAELAAMRAQATEGRSLRRATAPEVETITATTPRILRAVDAREDIATDDTRWGGPASLRGQILGLFRESARRRA